MPRLIKPCVNCLTEDPYAGKKSQWRLIGSETIMVKQKNTATRQRRSEVNLGKER